jgi:hypothetical protein
MVIVRCLADEMFCLERVVFPFELLSFESPVNAVLQIWTYGLGGPELLETIPVTELRLESEPAPTQPAPTLNGAQDDLLESWMVAG